LCENISVQAQCESDEGSLPDCVWFSNECVVRDECETRQPLITVLEDGFPWGVDCVLVEGEGEGEEGNRVCGLEVGNPNHYEAVDGVSVLKDCLNRTYDPSATRVCGDGKCSGEDSDEGGKECVSDCSDVRFVLFFRNIILL
jgi:coenzyme F420-reducing hydrogenase delta subunit